jgi:hypothetical protein
MGSPLGVNSSVRIMFVTTVFILIIEPSESFVGVVFFPHGVEIDKGPFDDFIANFELDSSHRFTYLAPICR